MFNEFLEVIEKAIPLIRMAETLPLNPEGKKQSVIEGLKRLLDQAPSIPASLKREAFISEVIDFIVAIGNLPGGKSSAIDVAKEGLDMILAYFKK